MEYKGLNNMTIRNMGMEGLITSYIPRNSLSLREVKVATEQSRNLEAGSDAEAVGGCCLLKFPIPQLVFDQYLVAYIILEVWRDGSVFIIK